MLAQPTAVPNTPAIALQPTGPGGTTSLNPVYTACDPTNGNYTTATGRDLLTFYVYPASSAPAWNSMITYTAGQVVTYSGTSYLALQLNVGQTPSSSPSSSYWAVYVDVDANLTIFSAPDACTGRKSDVNSYSIPLGAGSVEFLVLPSSVFTQANGQIQFLSSSNLVSVYVRSL